VKASVVLKIGLAVVISLIATPNPGHAGQVGETPSCQIQTGGTFHSDLSSAANETSQVVRYCQSATTCSLDKSPAPSISNADAIQKCQAIEKNEKLPEAIRKEAETLRKKLEGKGDAGNSEQITQAEIVKENADSMRSFSTDFAFLPLLSIPLAGMAEALDKEYSDELVRIHHEVLKKEFSDLSEEILKDHSFSESDAVTKCIANTELKKAFVKGRSEASDYRYYLKAAAIPELLPSEDRNYDWGSDDANKRQVACSGEGYEERDDNGNIKPKYACCHLTFLASRKVIMDAIRSKNDSKSPNESTDYLVNQCTESLNAGTTVGYDKCQSGCALLDSQKNKHLMAAVCVDYGFVSELTEKSCPGGSSQQQSLACNTSLPEKSDNSALTAIPSPSSFSFDTTTQSSDAQQGRE